MEQNNYYNVQAQEDPVSRSKMDLLLTCLTSLLVACRAAAHDL
jgi:hypothetical protein